MRESIAYDGAPGTTRRARAFAGCFLERARAIGDVPITTRAAEVVPLVVDELIANAGRYAPGPCLLELEITGHDLHVTVSDGTPTVPVPRGRDIDRVGRHGLEIVRALCAGFAVERNAAGKRVRARIPLT
ncbi:ATP-binding protein [Embleya sp. NPDC001921]